MPTTAKAKIGLDAIEQAHRALDALPEHRPEELTKTQAIQKLIVSIRATQSKGYSLAAIGQVLAECGIPITTGALRAYLSEARAGLEGKTKRKAKRAFKDPHENSPAPPKNSPKTPRTKAPEAPATPSAVGGTVSVGPTPNLDLDWEPGARSNTLVSRSGGESRTGFYVRPDTKDL